MSDFTWTTNDFELSEYLITNDNRALPNAFNEGEIIREIKNLEERYAALKRESDTLRLAAIRYLRNSYAKVGAMNLYNELDALLTEQDDA